MYAIIADGGRQYRVEEGLQLDIDRRDARAGEEIVFDRVLACRTPEGFCLGKPTVAGARVVAEVIGPVFGPKLAIQKLRRRKNFRRKTGHRQLHTRIQIRKIET